MLSTRSSKRTSERYNDGLTLNLCLQMRNRLRTPLPLLLSETLLFAFVCGANCSQSFPTPQILCSGRFLNAVHHTNANTYSASGRSRTLSNIAWRTVHALRIAGVELELMDERLRSMEDVPQTLRVFVLDCSCGAWTTLVVIPSSNTRGGRWT